MRLVLTNWRNETPRQYAVSTHKKNRESLVITGFVQEKLTLITVDTGATVSIVHPDVMKNLKPIGTLAACEQLSLIHI